MARFSVFANPDGPGFLLDVQADLLANLNTRVVVPLIPLDEAPVPARTLNPIFQVEGVTVVMVSQFLAAVPEKILKKPLGSLDGFRQEITAALDLLFQGF